MRFFLVEYVRGKRVRYKASEAQGAKRGVAHDSAQFISSNEWIHDLTSQHISGGDYFPSKYPKRNRPTPFPPFQCDALYHLVQRLRTTKLLTTGLNF